MKNIILICAAFLHWTHISHATQFAFLNNTHQALHLSGPSTRPMLLLPGGSGVIDLDTSTFEGTTITVRGSASYSTLLRVVREINRYKLNMNPSGTFSLSIWLGAVGSKSSTAARSSSSAGPLGLSRSKSSLSRSRAKKYRPRNLDFLGQIEERPDLEEWSEDFDDAVEKLTLRQIRAAAQNQGVEMTGIFAMSLIEQCAICTGDFGAKENHFFGLQRTYLSCGHAFCSACATQWTGPCPLCRASAVPIHTEYVPQGLVQDPQGFDAIGCAGGPPPISRTASCAGGGTFNPNYRTATNINTVFPALPPSEIVSPAFGQHGASAFHGAVAGNAIVQVAFPQDEIRPLDLVVVVDSSGSMSEVFDDAANAIGSALRQVPAGSRVTVVSFSDQALQVFPLQTPQASQYPILIQKVKDSNIGAGTALATGLAMAEKIFTQGHRAGVEKSLFIVTDGSTDGVAEVIPLVARLNSQTNGNFKICSLGSGVEVEHIREFLGEEFLATKYEHANNVDELGAVMNKVFSLSPASTSTVIQFPANSKILNSAAAGQAVIDIGPVCAGQSLSILAEVSGDFRGATLVYRDTLGEMHEIVSQKSDMLAERLPQLLKIRQLRIELNSLSNLVQEQNHHPDGSLNAWLDKLEVQIVEEELGEHYQELHELAIAIKSLLTVRHIEHNPAAEIAMANGLAAARARIASGVGRTMSAPSGNYRPPSN